MNKIGIALAIGMAGLLALAVYYAWTLWVGLAGVDVGVNGWAATILGAVLTLALGIGLMFLVFYSNRKGYDEIKRD